MEEKMRPQAHNIAVQCRLVSDLGRDILAVKSTFRPLENRATDKIS